MAPLTVFNRIIVVLPICLEFYALLDVFYPLNAKDIVGVTLSQPVELPAWYLQSCQHNRQMRWPIW